MLSEVELTKADFVRTQWEDAISNVHPRVCEYYAKHFSQRATDAAIKNDNRAEAVFVLLAVLTAMWLNLDSPGDPFAPSWVGNTGTSPTIRDVSANHWNVLGEIVTDVSDPDMRARIADALWVGKTDHRTALLAIDAYLESAKLLYDPEAWTYPCLRLERALQIAGKLGNIQKLGEICKFIEELLDSHINSDISYGSASLMELLLDHNTGDPAIHAMYAERLAHASESVQDWRRAKRYWEIAARLRARNQDSEGKRDALVHAAETYVRASEQSLAGDTPSYLMASTHLRCAIEAFRRVGKTQERVGALRAVLLNYQERAMNEMQRFGFELDVTEEAAFARKIVKGKPLEVAIADLALITKSPSKNAIQREVEERVAAMPLTYIAPADVVTESGRVTGRRPGMPLSAEDKAGEFLRAEMFKSAQLYQMQSTLGRVEPARIQIMTEHNPRMHDLLGLVTNNSFVPSGREEIYAKGLHAGLLGDFVVATSLLIPQLEHSLRYVLERSGILVTKHDGQGIQDVMDLNEVFAVHRAQLETFFGEDFVFDLQGMLVHRFGNNLRNRLAHGLLSYEELQSVHSIYLWWLVLRLCVVHMLAT